VTDYQERSPDCLSPEALASYLDGTLDAASRTRAAEHVDACADCHEALAMTVAMSESVSAATMPSGVSPQWQSWRRWTIAAGAVAAVVALFVFAPWRGRPAGRPELVELIAAAEGVRPVEGRLTGRFDWAPAPSATRGVSAAVPAEVEIAAAKLRQAVERDRTPGNLAAFATSRLFVGELDAAVGAFEEALALDDRSAAIWSDASSAYLARGASPSRSADLPRALEAADTAIAIDPLLAEAWFNRALALERVHLRQQAVAAWERYLALDPDGPWADEARARLEALRRMPAGAASRDADPLRTQLFDTALPAWTAAIAAGQDAAPAAGRARDLLAQIARLSEDALAAAAVAHVEGLAGLAASGRQRAADAYAAYASGRAAYERPDFDQALALFVRARTGLQAIGSPLALLARLHEGLIAYRQQRHAEMISIVAELRAAADASYFSLLGRADWIEGVGRASQGQRQEALALYDSAVRRLRRAGELDNEAFVRGLVATQYHRLGDPVRAWEARLQALEGTGREGPLLAAAFMAGGHDWHRAAADFAAASAAAARDARRLPQLADALRWQAMIASRLGDAAAAGRYLDEARTVIGDRRGDAWDRIRAETDLAVAAAAGAAEAEAGIAAAGRALAFFAKGNARARLPDVYRARARLHRLRAETAAAEADLRRGIEALVEIRAHVSAGIDQATYADTIRDLADDVVALQVERSAPDEAFALIESIRAADLLPAGAGAALTPAQLKSVLPPDAVMLAFVVGDARSYAWAVRRGETRFEIVPAGRNEIARLVAAATPPRANPAAAARLRQLLLAPFDAMIAQDDQLVIVPDGPLYAAAFGALPGRRARFLVEEQALLVAPSAAAWRHASARLRDRSRTAAPVVLAVGNPALPPAFEHLANLPHAEVEASVVAGIYGARPIVGVEATRAALVDGLRRADVVHFAGHALINALQPLQSRLVIADAAGDGFTAGELGATPIERAALVVLSACETVNGRPTRSEGPMGLARAFLSAGVPTVVASHWVASDRAARELFEPFHRTYRSSGDAARALRAAQIQLLSSADPALAAPEAWAGFVAIGGGPLIAEEVR
jgi:CHAT domain-containing protein/tetratricopeptide (TPR) repeat protein